MRRRLLSILILLPLLLTVTPVTAEELPEALPSATGELAGAPPPAGDPAEAQLLEWMQDYHARLLAGLLRQLEQTVAAMDLASMTPAPQAVPAKIASDSGQAASAMVCRVVSGWTECTVTASRVRSF